MPVLTITYGLPGCGKTTWANNEVKNKKSQTIILCRDDIRQMIAGSHVRRIPMFRFVSAMITFHPRFRASVALSSGQSTNTRYLNLQNSQRKWNYLRIR